MKFNPESAVVRVSMKHVARVLPFRACGDVRFYLEGVHVEPLKAGGVVVVATDGHTLVASVDPTGTADKPRTLRLPRSVARALCNERHELAFDGDGALWIQRRLPLERVWLSPTESTINCNYPDWRHVLGRMDSYVEGLLGGFNPAYILRALAVGGSSSDRTGVTWYHRKQMPHNSCALFTTTDGTFGLVMPMRVETDLARLIPAELFSTATAPEAKAA